MTRRKRSPSPSTPYKKAAFQIPQSLQQLSALSRSLAQQTVELGGRDDDANNARIFSQAQAPPESTPSATKLHSKIERPRYQKWIGQLRDFPEEQTWVQPVPRVPKPFWAPQQPDTSSPTLQTAPVQNSHPQTPLRPPAQSSVLTIYPTTTPVPHVSRAPSPTIPREAFNEPIAKAGEPLCLATQPNRIAALVAHKRAENEANNMRQKLAKAQFAHRLSQTPDNQLMDELNNELNRQSSISASPPRSKVGRYEKVVRQVAAQAERSHIERLKEYIQNGDDPVVSSIPSQDTNANIGPSKEKPQGHDLLFSSPAASPTTVNRLNHSLPTSPEVAQKRTCSIAPIATTPRQPSNSQLRDSNAVQTPTTTIQDPQNVRQQMQQQQTQSTQYVSNTSYMQQPIQSPPSAAYSPTHYRQASQAAYNQNQNGFRYTGTPYTTQPAYTHFHSPQSALVLGTATPYATMSDQNMDYNSNSMTLSSQMPSYNATDRVRADSLSKRGMRPAF